MRLHLTGKYTQSVHTEFILCVFLWNRAISASEVWPTACHYLFLSMMWCNKIEISDVNTCQSISVNTDIHLYFICICLKSHGMKLWWLLKNIRNSFVFHGKNTAYTVWYDMKETSWLNFHIWMNYSFNMEWGQNKAHYITSAKCFCKKLRHHLF